MYQVLKNAFDQHEVISWFIDPKEPNRCYSGYVVALNEREAVLLMLDGDGNVDMLAALNISQIFRIDIGGRYEQQLADAYKRIGNPYPPFVGKGDLFKAISEYAMEQHFPLWIAIHGDNEVGDFGNVLETNDEMIVITRLDDQNNENRSYISKQAINYIECEYKDNELSKTL